MNPDLSAAFESCLQKIQSGQTLEEALAGENHAAELRPLLESVISLRLLQPAGPAPAAQARSRSRFLTRAAELRSPAPVTPWWSRMRLATAVFTFVVIAVVSLVITGVVSSQALPGDFLYPVKIQVERAGETLTAGSSNRLVWQLTFDQRRSTEVSRLLSRGRRESVTFAGTLTQDAGGTWRAAGIALQIPAALQPDPALLGAYVDVHGFTHPDGFIEVTSLALRLFQISGMIEELQSNNWRVDSVRLTLTPQTRVDAGLRPGMRVEATAIRYAPDTMLALSIRAAKSNTGPSQPQATPAPLREQTNPPEIIQTETPEGSETVEAKETPGESPEETSETSPEKSDSPEVEETPGPEKTKSGGGATETPDKTDTSDETPEPEESPSGEG